MRARSSREADLFAIRDHHLPPPPFPGLSYDDNVLHVDADEICPRCLRWVLPGDIVRRSSYGLVVHEACPGEGGRP